MDPNLIFDIGVNNGDDSAYYLFKGFKVVGVEANPRLCQALKLRFKKEIASGRFALVERAISQTSEPVSFYINDWIDEWSALDKEVAGRSGLPTTEVQVQPVKLGELFSDYGVPYYLKTDIEGGDIMVLDSLARLQLPPYLSVEASSADYLKRLRDLGYTQFKCIDQQDHNSPDKIQKFKRETILERIKQPLRKLYSSHTLFRYLFKFSGLTKARSKKRFNEIAQGKPNFTGSGHWIFPAASSGPFGEDTYGTWQEFEEVFRNFKAWKAKDYDATSLSRDGWFDFHAKL